MEPDSAPPKPKTERIRSELTRLPPLTPGRKFTRRVLRLLVRLLVFLLTDTRVTGLEHIPEEGPALVVANHLGDADLLIGLAFGPRLPDTLAKVELYDIPVLGWLMEMYGVIWLHRGQPDRKALRAALQGLEEGRLVTIAPEGRESLTGGLEEATPGAAYLALKSEAPILPAVLTGTENRNLYGNLKRLRRTRITLTFGPVFQLEEDLAGRQEAIDAGTRRIMRTLAAMLPPEYRGVYAAELETPAQPGAGPSESETD